MSLAEEHLQNLHWSIVGLTDSTSYDVHVGKRLQKSLPLEAVEGLQKLELQLPIGSMYVIYANIWGILMGSMLPYIAAPWILWVMFCRYAPVVKHGGPPEKPKKLAMEVSGKNLFRWRGYAREFPTPTLVDVIWLVVWNMAFIFHFIYGMSSETHWQTHMFQDGWNHQPVIHWLDGLTRMLC